MEKTISFVKNGVPWEIFKEWLAESRKCNFKQVDYVFLATSNRQGRVTLRTVLLKEFSAKKGFIFYTNLNSRKGKNLKENPFASLLFYWDVLQKQIKIEGKCKILSAEATNCYFKQRPRNSRIAAWASKQSESVASRKDILEKYNYYQKKFAKEKDIPLPAYWRGVALFPSEIEFWEEREFRMHERRRFYLQKDGSWSAKILSP